MDMQAKAQSIREAIEGGASNSDLVQMLTEVQAAERERIVRRLREIADYECGCVEDGNLTRENAEQIEREGWA